MYNNIFLFWEGKDYKLIKILRNLIFKHNLNYNINLINDNNILEYIDNVPKEYYNLQYAHKADYVRVKVLNKFGGLWLDSDTLVMKNLKELFDFFEKYDGFLVLENNKFLINGVFSTKPNTNFMNSWEKYIDSFIMNKNIQWTDLGSKFINNNLELLKNYKILKGLDSIYPIYWKDCVSEFLKKKYQNYKNIERNFQPLIILVNSVYKEYEKMTNEEINNSPINYFLNKSIENAENNIY